MKGKPMSNPQRRVAYQCCKCGSRTVGWDAVAYWCEETQQPVLGPTFDDGWCEICGPDARLNEIVLDQPESATAQ
jgi:hypothetical protein